MTYVRMHYKNKADIIAHVLSRNGITVWYGIPEQILTELKANVYKVKKRKKFKKLLQKVDLHIDFEFTLFETCSQLFLLQLN